MNSAALHLLGLARKGGRVEVGEEPVSAIARSGHARVILVASDAAENSLRRAQSFAENSKTPFMHTPFTKEEMGHAVGRSTCAMLALTDFGLAAAIGNKLAQQNPEQYAEVAALLSQKNDRAQERLKEKRRHEKKLQQQRAKPWVAPPKASSGKKTAEKRSAGEAKQPTPQAKRPIPKGKVTIKRKNVP